MADNKIRGSKLELVEVDYVFTDDEQTQHAKQLADETSKLEKLEDEKKEMASNFKAKIDAATSRARLLSNYITSGHDRRTMHCIVERDFTSKIKKYFAPDGRLVGEDPLTQDDYQMKAELEEA